MCEYTGPASSECPPPSSFPPPAAAGSGVDLVITPGLLHAEMSYLRCMPDGEMGDVYLHVVAEETLRKAKTRGTTPLSCQDYAGVIAVLNKSISDNAFRVRKIVSRPLRGARGSPQAASSRQGNFPPLTSPACCAPLFDGRLRTSTTAAAPTSSAATRRGTRPTRACSSAPHSSSGGGRDRSR